MSLRTFAHGTVMCTPLAGRIESGWRPSSRARTLSDHTPVAFTTARADRQLRAVDDHAHPLDAAGRVLLEADHRGVVHDRGAVLGRGPGDGECEPGVVGVVVDVGRREARSAQRRHVPEGGVLRDAPVQLADPQASGHVVHPHRGAEGAGEAPVDQPVGGEDREQERLHAHEVGRGPPQHLALGERFVDEPDLALLEVAQAPVHELRRLRRRSRREVVPLDQGGPQAPARGVERATRAGDAATDDHDVERFGREAPDPVGAVEAHRPRLPLASSWGVARAP